MSVRLVLTAALAGGLAASGALWPAFSHAQETAPILPELPGAGDRSGSRAGDGSWNWGEVAVLRGLDKVTAVTRDFEAPVGEDVRFYALTISVKRCAKRPPEEPPEVIVGMEIHDRQTDGEGNEIEPERIFAGWMFASSPALNPLEHGVYDVWVVDCLVAETAEPES